MKVVFAGQLDRVFANEFAIFVGPESDDHWDLNSVEAQRSADSRYFQLAGTLAALSDEIVSLPYVRYALDPVFEDHTPESSENTVCQQAHMSRMEAIFDSDLVANEALELAKVCALMGQLAVATDEVLDDVDTEEAWIGHYHALKHLHGEHGVPLAYLAGLLMQAHLAWKEGAVLALAECDRLILADLGAMIVRNRWPRPFAIPDLRYMSAPYNRKTCGPLVDLRPADLTDVQTLKDIPCIHTYAETISQILSNADGENIGPALEKAKRSISSGLIGLTDRDANIRLVAANARMFSNAHTVPYGGKTAQDAWSRRRIGPRRLRTIVLS